MPPRDQGEVAPLETPVIQPVEVPAASHDAVSTEAVAVSTEAAAVAAEAALVEEEVTPAAAAAAPTPADADGDKDDEAGVAYCGCCSHRAWQRRLHRKGLHLPTIE